MKSNGPGHPSRSISVFYNRKISILATCLVKNDTNGVIGQKVSLVAAYVRMVDSKSTYVPVGKLVGGMEALSSSLVIYILWLWPVTSIPAFIEPNSSRTTALRDKGADPRC